MHAHRSIPLLIAGGLLVGLATASLAQQSPTKSDKALTIDCPPTAATGEAATQAETSPPGAGSGLMAMPSVGPPQRVDGTVKTIDSSRTNRILEVGAVKLEVEPSTVILVGCKPSSMADLKPGVKITAMYEIKAPNRTVATVIEAEN